MNVAPVFRTADDDVELSVDVDESLLAERVVFTCDPGVAVLLGCWGDVIEPSESSLSA